MIEGNAKGNWITEAVSFVKMNYKVDKGLGRNEMNQ